MNIPGGETDEPWTADDAASGPADAGQLDLDAGDEQLPWLESDEDYEDEGVDTARILILAAVGLMAIALAVGGIWWATHRGPDPAMMADGSTIAAPEGPYKTKPEEPGGKTFAGTGDTSFAVGEGQSREGKIAETQLPRPSLQTMAPAPASASPAPSASAAPAKPVPNGVGVQVGAYSTRASAEAGWSRLQRDFSDLQGLNHRVVEGQADIGTVYRLQALAPDLASAKDLCSRLKAAGGACQVKP